MMVRVALPSRRWAAPIVACLLAVAAIGSAPGPADASDPPLAGAATFRGIGAGAHHTCAIRTDGALACWGENHYGQATPPDGSFSAVSAGASQACAIGADRRIACWGNNEFGQATPPEGAFNAVSAGEVHACAIRTDGVLACWGGNHYGQATPPDGSYSAVSAGFAHTCAIQTGGTVACWGWDQDGQATPPEGAFSAVSAGAQHTCAITAAGAVTCWGYNGYGQATPAEGTFSAVSAGERHTCAITTDGTIACWGNNELGQAAPPEGTFNAVSAGDLHSCAIWTDGKLACWGNPDARPYPTAEVISPRWIASRTVSVGWSAVPALYPVTSYDVRYQRLRWNSSGYGSEGWLSATAATSGRFTGSPGSTFCFEARASDAAGNVSPWPSPPDHEDYWWQRFDEAACTAIPLDDRSLARSAGWTAITGDRFYRATALRTFRHGSALTKAGVVADRLRLVATTCPTCGRVQVYVNRRLVQTISLHSRTRVDRAVLPVGRVGSRDPVTVTVKVVSWDRKVIIDGLSVYRAWLDE